MTSLPELAVEFKEICKSFHGRRANDSISFKVRKGSIHAIIGENGAGKSTAMEILYGTYHPDQGEIFIDGKSWGGRGRPWVSPSDAIHCGIGMVHQHFMLADPHTALENILLGVDHLSSKWKWLPRAFRPMDKSAALEKLKRISSQYGLPVDWNSKIEDLPVGIQQRIEILKLLFRDANILILDEPTAVLTPQETNELFSNLRKLKEQGKTIIIITHKLKEVMNLADEVTVFRAGKVVGERLITNTSIEDLACLMVGRKVTLQGEVPPPPKVSQPVLQLSGVSLPGHRRLEDLNFEVKGGEVVGISGVEGNGQSELIQLLLHPKDHSSHMSGTIKLFGKDVGQLNAAQVKSLGVGVIPDDRLRDALLLDRPVSENFLLGLQRRKPFYSKGLISSKKLEERTRAVLEEYDVRPRSTRILAGQMSGGNQQKLVIAREFEFSPQFLIAAQPTRGVDIGAIEFIHKRILKAREEGCGVLLISSELDEIFALSDRILIMFEGKIIDEFARGQVTEKTVGLRMGGEASL